MDNIFAFIKSHVSIINVVQEYVTLKKSGLYLKGRCPFHDETNDSFTISPHKEIFYCFGCHKGGDVISFISEIENCSPIEAAQHIAEHYGIDIPESLKKITEINSRKITQYSDLCTEVANWCHEQLLKSSQAKDYLLKRNILKQSINDFTLGYFPENGINSLLSYTKKRGILAKDLIEAHIISENQFGLYSPFVDRIILPIKDHLGRVCGFGGRVFQENDPRVKYFNSQDHEFFTKGHILFGLNLAKKEIQEKQFAFLVEGYIDCIAMVQAGYKNTIATLGTACTEEHLKILSRYAQKLYVMYDGDNAGQNAIIKLTQLVWATNIDLYVLSLPKMDDPASFLEKNKNLDSILPSLQDIFSFFIQKIGNGYVNKSLQERLELVHEFINILANVHDPIKKNFLLQKASVTFDIPFNILAENLRKKSKAPENQNKIEKVLISKLDTTIFATLVNNPIELSLEELELIKKHCNKPIALLIEKIMILCKDRKKFVFSEFLNSLSNQEQEIAIRLAVEGESTEKLSIKELLTPLWKKEWKLILNNFKVKIKQAEQNSDIKAIETITKEFGELKNKLKEKGIL